MYKAHSFNNILSISLPIFQEKSPPFQRVNICVKKWERQNTSLPLKIFLTGAEAKRSFAQSSFAFFSFKKRRWERRNTSLPLKILLTGAEAKRSFAQNSLPSFLLRKRVRVLPPGSSWPPCRRWPMQTPADTSETPVPPFWGPPARKSPYASGWP